MKRFSFALVVLLACFSLAYAGTRITDMTAIGSLELTDILEVVDDPGGSPLSRSATFQQVADVVSTDTDIADAISKKHAQNTDTGTTSGTFQIDSGNTGPKIKNNAGVLESRNAADDAYADFVGKDITGETAKLSDLGDGKIPYHVDDATGLADGPTKTDVDSAVSLKHTQNTDTGTTETSFTIDSGGSIVKLAATKTNAAISKSIGATGDYATHALAIAALPDLLAHSVTHTIQAGTTLTETCYIQNKHSTATGADYTLQAEKYFPTSGSLPTADSATGTTLVDAALATAAKGDDYFNGCWIFIVDGTGTDNGFVAITDYTDVSGTVTVASWPGTQPDSTSRYLIVGALVDGESSRTSGIYISNCTASIYLYGIGVKSITGNGIYSSANTYPRTRYIGVYEAGQAGIHPRAGTQFEIWYCGIVKCNTSSNSLYGGIRSLATDFVDITKCALSDNNVAGIKVSYGSIAHSSDCYGDGNGTWGSYAENAGIIKCSGTECSGSSGDHSNGVGDGSLAY